MSPPLALGDRLVGRPCVVTIIRLSPRRAVALGWCDTCDDAHLIDRERFDAGEGPWRREPSVTADRSQVMAEAQRHSPYGRPET